MKRESSEADADEGAAGAEAPAEEVAEEAALTTDRPSSKVTTSPGCSIDGSSDCRMGRTTGHEDEDGEENEAFPGGVKKGEETPPPSPAATAGGPVKMTGLKRNSVAIGADRLDGGDGTTHS